MLHQQLLHRRALATAGGGRARTLAPCSRPAAAALALSASAAAAAAPAAAPASPASPALRRPRPLVAAAAAAAKGFGANQGKAPPGDGCPCGSGLLYKACCKPHHQLRAPPPPTVEATVRARFSAVVKKEMPFLLRTFHPSFHCVMYNTEPGGAAEKLEDDMWCVCAARPLLGGRPPVGWGLPPHAAVRRGALLTPLACRPKPLQTMGRLLRQTTNNPYSKKKKTAGARATTLKTPTFAS